MKENNVGINIKNLLNESGLNQEQLADFLGVHQSYISKCQSGTRRFAVDDLEKLASLFGCTTEAITGNEENCEPIQFAFRASGIGKEDLSAIADINRIALNIQQMKEWMGREQQ